MSLNFQSCVWKVVIFLCLCGFARGASVYVPSTTEPPGVRREFRGVWVATVNNIDWPSRPGLPVNLQKEELLILLDRAVKLNLNAFILQVRPSADAFYASKLEPWSYYLTGAMGSAPEPFYDPLAFAIEEAHKRGLELHAYFNPYRAALLSTKYVFSSGHVSRLHPDWIRKYGKLLWLDPGEKEVADYSLKVIMDVVNRYDVDGIHLDDYFYPYQEQDAQKRDIPFPDQETWKKYGVNSGLSRADWRRQNISSFVERVYNAIKLAKPWVKFGVAPFGIWQPGSPPEIKKSFNSFEVLYSDSRKWLQNGWVDYYSPQLYWAIDSDDSFPVLLKWWNAQNLKHRNIWPGISTDRVGAKFKPMEIINQIKITRELNDGSAGVVQWHMKSLMLDLGGINSLLQKTVYAEPALVPASPWLENRLPAKPRATIQSDHQLRWIAGMGENISVWLLQTKINGHWETQILPGRLREKTLENSPDLLALTAIDRCGVASQPIVLEKSNTPKK